MFVGRERELEELESAIGRLAGGAGSLFLITGEPGIGKTRLVAEAVARARTRGIRIATGQCWEAGGAPALWPWTEALEQLELAMPAPGAAPDVAEARFELFRDIAGALARAAASSPIAIVLEDLHAADRSTLSLLEFISSRLGGVPVMVIGTYRDLEASLSPDTSRALDRASRAGTLHQLGRLARAEVAAYVTDALRDTDERRVAEIYETTAGNPLFVEEIVRDLRAGRGGQVPLGVREVIRQRLALISPEARRVLETAAVLGVELAAADVERIEAGASAVFDDAARSGLVIARGDRIRFAHALYREALYHDLARPRRQELHRAVARALAATGAPLSEIAHHLLEAGPDAAADAIEQTIRAAQQALAVFAFEDGAALLERARAAIPGENRALRCRVMIALGELQLRSGDPGGKALCVEAATLARELGDARLLAMAGLAYGTVFMMGGVDPVLVGMLEEVLAGLPSDDALRPRAMARLAAARQPSPPDERRRDIELAFQAVELGRKLAEPRELLEILSSASGVLYGAIEPTIRIQYSKEQERLAEQLGDVPRLLAARTRLSLDYLELGDFAAHAELANSLEQLVQRIGPAAAPWRVPLMRSFQAMLAGQFARSEELQAEVRRHDHPRAKRALAFHRIGFLSAAERHADLRAALPELRGLWLQMPYGGVLAEPRVAAVLARIGADDELRALLAKLPPAAYEEEINWCSLAETVWMTADPAPAAMLRSDRWTQAQMPRGYALRDGWPFYWFDCEIVEPPTARIRAYLAAVAGAWDECEQLHARALREVEAAGARHLAARMRFELGDLMLRLGREPERARGLVAEGRAAAAELGLDELVAMIDRRHANAPAPQRAGSTFALQLEGEYYAIATTRGVLRFKSTRGMQYLARLVETPNVDVHVLELVGSSDLADRGDAGELLDGPAMRAYRGRLEALRDTLEDAEAIGDSNRAERARAEMEAIAAEISRGTGKGGKARRAESPVDRARSAVQRRIKDAIDRIAEQDGELGKRLRQAVRTGNYCSYRDLE